MQLWDRGVGLELEHSLVSRVCTGLMENSLNSPSILKQFQAGSCFAASSLSQHAFGSFWSESAADYCFRFISRRRGWTNLQTSWEAWRGEL